MRLVPLRGQGPGQLALGARREHHLAVAQGGLPHRLGPVQVALEMPGRHSFRRTIDERLQMLVQGVHPRQAQLSPFVVELGLRTPLRRLALGGRAGNHHVRGLGISRRPGEPLPAVGAQHRAVRQALQQRVRDVVAPADHPFQLGSAPVHRRDHGNLLPRQAPLGRFAPPARRTPRRGLPPLPSAAALEAVPKEGLVGLDHAAQRLRVRVGERPQNHGAPSPQRAPRHAEPAEPVQIVDREVARSHRADEPRPQLGLAHAGERGRRQAVERAAAAALLPHAEKALPAPGVDAVPMRAAEPAARADPAGVPVPGVVRDRGPAGLGLSLRLHMPLHFRELVGIQLFQQAQDQLVDVVFHHACLHDGLYVCTAPKSIPHVTRIEPIS